MLCESEFNSMTFSNKMIYHSKTYVNVGKKKKKGTRFVAWP